MGGGLSPKASLMSPDVHGTPVGQPSSTHPIRMDRYQFGEGPTLALGFSTSRSIASPGASSTYSAERSDVYNEDNRSDYAGEDDDDRMVNDMVMSAKRGSVTWSAEVVTRDEENEDGVLTGRKMKLETDNEIASRAAYGAMASPNIVGVGGGVGGVGGVKKKGGGGMASTNITYETNWDSGVKKAEGGRKGGGGKGAVGGSGRGGGRGGGRGSVGTKRNANGGGGGVGGKGGSSAYNVGVKSMQRSNDRLREAGRRGQGAGRGGRGKTSKSIKPNPDTLSRAAYAIQSARAVLLDKGPYYIYIYIYILCLQDKYLIWLWLWLFN